jgi:DNA-binding NtrC family response regulator
MGRDEASMSTRRSDRDESTTNDMRAVIRLAAGNLIGESPKFVNALRIAARVAGCEATVLVRGETGTGKELFARAVHYSGPRAAGPFVPVNCGAIPDTLIESEFFGHRKGSFTDARQDRVGLVGQAEGGTLFLDEIETMTSRAQVVLLRFLQDSEYRPIGSRGTQRSNVRVLAATNTDLARLAQAGQWRADLLYRLQVVTLDLPPLRERGEDVVLLARVFAKSFANRYCLRERALTPRAVQYLLTYSWPGNVRELENAIHRQYLIYDRDSIDLPEMDAESPQATGESALLTAQAFRCAKMQAVNRFERAYLTELLGRTGGNVSQAARLAGKERRSLGKLLRKHGLARVAGALVYS